MNFSGGADGSGATALVGAGFADEVSDAEGGLEDGVVAGEIVADSEDNLAWEALVPAS